MPVSASKARHLASTKIKNSSQTASVTLRSRLRESTAALHDLLDGLMRDAAGWNTREEYIDFLTLQHTARLPVESWLLINASGAQCPPPQCDLIAKDLAAMGAAPARRKNTPALPLLKIDCDGGHDNRSFVLGVAWTLAGSALGNRAILKEIRKINLLQNAETWPHSFLADRQMLDFWHTIKSEVERPASAAYASSAAHASAAVFQHFIACAKQSSGSARPTQAAANEDRLTITLSQPSCPVIRC